MILQKKVGDTIDTYNVEECLEKAQNALENFFASSEHGKILKVGEDGRITTVDFPTWDIIKPTDGIPKIDLASAIQASLNKADSAYQKPNGGIPASDLAFIPVTNKQTNNKLLIDTSESSTVKINGGLQVTEGLITNTIKATGVGSVTQETDITNLATITSEGYIKKRTIANVKKDLGLYGISDFIIEENTQKIEETNYTSYRRYRKWNSGLIENWIDMEYKVTVSIDNKWPDSTNPPYIYRSDFLGGQSWAMAFTTTNNLSIIGTCTDSTSGNGAWIAQYGAKNTTTIPRYYLCRPSSTTSMKPQVSWYACGT